MFQQLKCAGPGLATNWQEEQEKPRGKKIKSLLTAQGYAIDRICLTARINNVDTFVFPDAVCMAILEYYAFEASQGSRDQALANYRYLARVSFRQYIYNTCGYDPKGNVPKEWQNYLDRVQLNDQIPVRYFSVFREIAEIIVHMIRNGCVIDSKTVPDISVGRLFSSHWTDKNYDTEFGFRHKYPHNYPESFPQSAANPVEAYIYPVDALGVFRRWVYETYIPKKFPAYLERKVQKFAITTTTANLILEAVKKDQPKIDIPTDVTENPNPKAQRPTDNDLDDLT